MWWLFLQKNSYIDWKWRIRVTRKFVCMNISCNRKLRRVRFQWPFLTKMIYQIREDLRENNHRIASFMTTQRCITWQLLVATDRVGKRISTNVNNNAKSVRTTASGNSVNVNKIYTFARIIIINIVLRNVKRVVRFSSKRIAENVFQRTVLSFSIKIRSNYYYLLNIFNDSRDRGGGGGFLHKFLSLRNNYFNHRYTAIFKT